MKDLPTEIISEYTDDPDLREVAEMFISHCPKMLQDIGDALSAGDVDQLKFHIHSFKGAGGSSGYPLLAERAAAIEEQIAHSELEKVVESVRELSELCDRVRA